MPKATSLELKLALVEDVRTELAQIIHTPNYQLSSFSTLSKKWNIYSVKILQKYLSKNELEIRKNYIKEQNIQKALTRLKIQNVDAEFRAKQLESLRKLHTDPQWQAANREGISVVVKIPNGVLHKVNICNN